MRRKHQQMFGRREYIREIPNSRPKVRKTFCNKVSEKDDNTVQSIEAIKQSLTAAENDRRIKIIERIIEIVLPIVLLFAIVIFIFLLCKEPEDKQDNVILRHYTEVIGRLEDEPEDITLYQYEANVPSIIQKDIDKMLEMGDGAMVVYYNDIKDQVVIERSEESENGYRVRFKDENNLFSIVESDELESSISFYKNGDTLVIYGGPRNIRILSRYSINNKGVDYDYPDKSYVDLYGTNVKYDDIRYFNSNFTLIRQGSEFSFYHLGEKEYTTKFQGGTIVDWSYHYISTDQKSCYNVYYSARPKDCWIKFYKVADNVDEVLEDEQIIVPYGNGDRMEFPIFRIGDKKYAQIPDPAAERAYGQNYGGNNRNDKQLKVDFTSRLVEVSALSSSKVELVYEFDSWREDNYVWKICYYFQVEDRECYVVKRINGLDPKISPLIPEEKREMFNHKVILPDEIEEYINQLKLLYDEYTDNTF